MAKEWAKPFYNSKQWKQCRKSYIAHRISIDGGMCEHCHRELGYIVDHITELSLENINDTNITLNHDNMQYLCLKCHNTKTFSKHGGVASGLMFDENGDLVWREEDE